MKIKPGVTSGAWKRTGEKTMSYEDEGRWLLDKDRWIGQLNDLYRRIVEEPTIPKENLDKANNIILEAIQKLQSLAISVADTGNEQKEMNDEED